MRCPLSVQVYENLYQNLQDELLMFERLPDRCEAQHFTTHCLYNPRSVKSHTPPPPTHTHTQRMGQTAEGGNSASLCVRACVSESFLEDLYRSIRMAKWWQLLLIPLGIAAVYLVISYLGAYVSTPPTPPSDQANTISCVCVCVCVCVALGCAHVFVLRALSDIGAVNAILVAN